MKRGLLFVFLLTWIVNIGNAQVSKTQVGATYYDLQTNNAIERRIIIDPVSKKRVITYTGSGTKDGSAGAYNDRGTGYYYYSGTGALPTVTSFPARPESVRVGWPSPLFLKGNKEIILTHQAGTSNGLYSVYRANAGMDTWTQAGVNTGFQTWPRAGNSGDSIFLISSLSTQNNTTPMFGMLGGIGFKRSYDGGLTWTPPANTADMDSIKGLNLAKYPNIPNGQAGNVIGGDQYSLDVKGKTVAILTGANDVTLFVSNDFGNNWTMTTIVEGDNNTGDPLPKDLRSGGDYSVLIDNNNKIHCFWGLTYSDGNSFELKKAGIVYWNNITPNMKPKVIYKTSYELESNPFAKIYFPLFTQLEATRQTSPSVANQVFYGSGYTCNPSSGVDASNAIYLSYQRTRGINDSTRLKSRKLIDGRGNMYTDCYLIKSIDNGASWIGPINVSNSDSLEDAYPSIARFVDDSVHIVYQEDSFAGFVINNTLSDPNLNKIIYARVAVKDIVTPNDITPPILTKKDNISTASGGVITDSTRLDTLKILVGCNLESVFQDTFYNVKDFVLKHIVQAYDNSDSVIIIIDTPANFSTITPGTYFINIRAKDLKGNYSPLLLNVTGQIVFSLDTLKLILVVDNKDVSPPVITMTQKVQYIKLGTPYTLPTPVANVTDNNWCGTPSTTYPSASEVDVNKVGLYNLVVTATDLNNNKASDTLQVNVGDGPNPTFSNQAIANGKITATGTTEDIAPIYPNTGYQWKTKSSSGKVVNLATTKDLNYTIKSSTESFDSLCYDVKNIFNDKITSIKVKTTCKALKYTSGGGGGVGIHQVSENNIKFEVAPNPNSGNFKLQYEGVVKATEALISIQDINGRIIYDQKIAVKGSGEVPIRLTNITNGTYFINAQIGENHFLRKLEISK